MPRGSNVHVRRAKRHSNRLLKIRIQTHAINGINGRDEYTRIHRNEPGRFGRRPFEATFVRLHPHLRLAEPSHLSYLSSAATSTVISPYSRGVYASIMAFLLFSMIQFRDGPFIRPHPAFWRVMLGINLLYELALVFLLFQDLDAARGYMKLIDPSLGVPLPEKDYSQNCELTFTNIWVCITLNVCGSPILTSMSRTLSTSSVLHISWVGLGRL